MIIINALLSLILVRHRPRMRVYESSFDCHCDKQTYRLNFRCFVFEVKRITKCFSGRFILVLIFFFLSSLPLIVFEFHLVVQFPKNLTGWHFSHHPLRLYSAKRFFYHFCSSLGFFPCFVFYMLFLWWIASNQTAVCGVKAFFADDRLPTFLFFAPSWLQVLHLVEALFDFVLFFVR